jgi:hypothetical protein
MSDEKAPAARKIDQQLLEKNQAPPTMTRPDL